MIGLILVVTAMIGSLLIRVLINVPRGRGVGIGVDDVAWWFLALAVVTGFFGLLPGTMYSPYAALAIMNKLLSLYNGLINSLTWSDAVISVTVNVGLPIAEAVSFVVTGTGIGSIVLVVEVLEQLVSAVVGYIVHVFSIVVSVLWFIRFAIAMGIILGKLVPYLAFLLVMPRTRNAAVIPISLYLLLGIALPLGINAVHAIPMISVANESQLPPWRFGFADVEVVDALGRPIPAVLCINGFGYQYNETLGLPSGSGLVVLPIRFSKYYVSRYVINCVVALFMRFSADHVITPVVDVNDSVPVLVQLPMISVFNGDSLAALYNYTWRGVGLIDLVSGDGYAIINVTTPCNGELIVNAYAAGIDLKVINTSGSNCSITYTMSQGKPGNLVQGSWLQSVWLDHELFCQDLEQLINPSIMPQGIEAPPQLINQLLNIINESCSGIGNYTEPINELRSIRLSVSFRCLGNCSDVNAEAIVRGVRPYSFNYYALWGGSYVDWLNGSLVIIRNAANFLSLGFIIGMFINIAYSSALVLGFVGIIAAVPRIKYWSRLMGIVSARLGIGYEDLVSVAESVAVRIINNRRANQGGFTSRYVLPRGLRGFVNRWYVRHVLRTGYWALRELPRVSVMPYVELPALYGVSLARDYLMRRATRIENRVLRDALRTVVGITVSSSLVLRPYSLVNPLVNQSVSVLARHFGYAVREASQAYGALRGYLGGAALYVALRSVVRGVNRFVVDAVGDIWSSLDDPLRALAAMSSKLGALYALDRDLARGIADEALRVLVSRHGLVSIEVLVNGAVVKPMDVFGVGDYEVVAVRLNDRYEFVKAWVAKEFLRVIGLGGI
ncbi:hypothetical protein [Vulcanisaeta souniana]|nr:hypothetical protein [Vulcanisaeta souniana]GGI82090.1 hypothetical protein GCM10007112_18540 [Vulcanisaeta souniana JCM 11219]